MSSLLGRVLNQGNFFRYNSSKAGSSELEGRSQSNDDHFSSLATTSSSHEDLESKVVDDSTDQNEESEVVGPLPQLPQPNMDSSFSIDSILNAAGAAEAGTLDNDVNL